MPKKRVSKLGQYEVGHGGRLKLTPRIKIPAHSILPPAETLLTPPDKIPSGDKIILWIEDRCCVPEGKRIGKQFLLDEWQKDEIRRIYDNPHGAAADRHQSGARLSDSVADSGRRGGRSTGNDARDRS